MGYGRMAQVGRALALSQGATVATTSGTTVTVASSISAAAQRISLNFNQVRTNTVAQIPLLVQLGTSAGFVVAGYQSRSYLSRMTVSIQRSYASYTTGFGLGVLDNVTTINGVMHLINADPDNFIWVANMIWGVGGTFSGSNWQGTTGGQVTLPGRLTQIRLNTGNGTDQYANGSIGIQVE